MEWGTWKQAAAGIEEQEVRTMLESALGLSIEQTIPCNEDSLEVPFSPGIKQCWPYTVRSCRIFRVVTTLRWTNRILMIFKTGSVRGSLDLTIDIEKEC